MLHYNYLSSIPIAILCALALQVPLDAQNSISGQNLELKTRPSINGEATDVFIHFSLADINDVVDAKQSIEATLGLFISWHDPSLAHSNEYSVYYSLDAIWDPGITVLNASDIRKEEDRRIEVTPDGTVIMEEVYRGSFSQSFDLRDFPFDHQQFEITFTSPGNRPSEVVLKAHPDHPSGINPLFTLPDWKIDGWSSEAFLYRFNEQSPGRYVFRIMVDANRSASYFVFKIIIPLIIIMGMSWLVYWIHPSNVEAQIGMGATSMLTLIAFQFSIDQLLPQIPYLTRLDQFILLSMIMVFANLVESVTTSYLYYSDRKELSLKVDRYGRWIYLAALLALILFTLVF